MSKSVLVREFMVTQLVTLSPELDICSAMRLLLHHHISGAPVVDADRHLLGILSEKDCLRVFANEAYFQEAVARVSDYMTRAVVTVKPEDELFQVADLLLKNTFRRLPVLEGGKLVGQVSRHDVLLASIKLCKASSVTPPFSDTKYLTEEMKAALVQPLPTES